MDVVENICVDSEMWDIFTKKEEYEPLFLDQFGRFRYYSSKHRDVVEPHVSKYLIDKGWKPEYPQKKKFAVCLTHDIDVIKYGLKVSILNAIMSTIGGDLSTATQYLLHGLIKKKHPHWNFQEIINLEEQYGAKSSFYFLALKPGEDGYNYRLEEVADEILYISNKGWEVGLHGGHESFNNLEDMVQKKKMLENILGKQVIGYRNHYLRFKTPDTWELLSKAGFKYDTTFGYADCAGFRNGMCHPFKPFNLKTNKQIDILEIPLVIMDGTIFKDYMKLNPETAWELTKQLIDTVEKYRGVLTILWHNTYMQGSNLKFYEKILEYCLEKNAWLTNGQEIWDWWDNNV